MLLVPDEGVVQPGVAEGVLLVGVAEEEPLLLLGRLEPPPPQLFGVELGLGAFPLLTLPGLFCAALGAIRFASKGRGDERLLVLRRGGGGGGGGG